MESINSTVPKLVFQQFKHVYMYQVQTQQKCT